MSRNSLGSEAKYGCDELIFMTHLLDNIFFLNTLILNYMKIQ